MDEELRVGDERWRAIVEQARRQGNAKNLPRPAGYEDVHGGDSGYALIKFRLVDGRVSCQLRLYRRKGTPSVLVGSFVMEADRGRQVRRRVRSAPGAPTAGRVIALACGRSVRVEVDGLGLPYPVPVEMAGPSTNGHTNARIPDPEAERVEFF